MKTNKKTLEIQKNNNQFELINHNYIKDNHDYLLTLNQTIINSSDLNKNNKILFNKFHEIEKMFNRQTSNEIKTIDNAKQKKLLKMFYKNLSSEIDVGFSSICNDIFAIEYETYKNIKFTNKYSSYLKCKLNSQIRKVLNKQNNLAQLYSLKISQKLNPNKIKRILSYYADHNFQHMDYYRKLNSLTDKELIAINKHLKDDFSNINSYIAKIQEVYTCLATNKVTYLFNSLLSLINELDGISSVISDINKKIKFNTSNSSDLSVMDKIKSNFEMNDILELLNLEIEGAKVILDIITHEYLLAQEFASNLYNESMTKLVDENQDWDKLNLQEIISIANGVNDWRKLIAIVIEQMPKKCSNDIKELIKVIHNEKNIIEQLINLEASLLHSSKNLNSTNSKYNYPEIEHIAKMKIYELSFLGKVLLTNLSIQEHLLILNTFHNQILKNRQVDLAQYYSELEKIGINNVKN